MRCRYFALILLTAAVVRPQVNLNVAWSPITDAELQMKSPVVDKNAGVEAIFWRVNVTDEIAGQDLQRVLYHYIRLKVFNKAGVDKASIIDLPFNNKNTIVNVSGRTIKPDGTILELPKDAIHERTILRAGGMKWRAKALSMPGVEPGVIVEYRWKEIRSDESVRYMRMQFQQEFPVQKVTYYMRPLPGEYTNYKMGMWPFNCTPSPIKYENNGFSSTGLENVPAFKEEPMMPGEGNVRKWALIYYHEDTGEREVDKYWDKEGKRIYRDIKPSLSLNGDLRQAAKTAGEGASDAEKIDGLVRYIRANVRNLFGPDVTESERAALLKSMPKERHRTSVEVLHSGIGTSYELNTLFVAMATALGFEARPAYMGDRSDITFTPQLTDAFFLRDIDTAVKIGDQWKIYDVNARLLPPGMLAWQEEGMKTLLADPKQPQFIDAPISPPAASLASRAAHLALDAEGTLSGSVALSYTGHTALGYRAELDRESESRRLEIIKEKVTRIFPQAEVSGIKIENLSEPIKPLSITYDVRVPQYADRTGKRLFFHPFFFQVGSTPMFAAADRQFDVEFHHAWKEHDQITLKLPAGFELDHPEQPGIVRFGEPGAYAAQIRLGGPNDIVCTRELVFGDKGLLVFHKPAYKIVKEIFDEIQRRDTHTLALKQTAAAGAGQQ